jgi:hypothetical protein
MLQEQFSSLLEKSLEKLWALLEILCNIKKKYNL